MAANDTANTTAFVEAERYSAFIIENLHDGLLPETFARNVSELADGTTLNIKTVGTRTIQDVQEGVAMTFNPIDSGNVTLTITDYVGDAWSVSDELREDGTQVDQLSALMAMESTRAIQENYETKFLQACSDAQTANGDNDVNTWKHRFYAGETGTDLVFELDDLAFLKHVFNKANVPEQGRILIVDSVVELTLNTLTNITNVSNNIHFEGVVNEGFARNHQFVKNIYGFDIWTSNRLPVTTGDLTSVSMRDDGAVTGAAGNIINVALCVADDNCRPMMNAWRRQPSVEGWREHELREDRFQQSARYGFGAQRVDTLATIISSATAY